MKLPRWLMILMLTMSTLSVLAAAGWWGEVEPPETSCKPGAEQRSAGRDPANSTVIREPVEAIDTGQTAVGPLGFDMAISRDDRILATSGAFGGVKIWDIGTGQLLRTFEDVKQ